MLTRQLILFPPQREMFSKLNAIKFNRFNSAFKLNPSTFIFIYYNAYNL